MNFSLALGIRKLNSETCFVNLKKKISGLTKILDLAIFRFFLLERFALVLVLLTLYSLLSSLITIFSVTAIRLIAKDLPKILSIEINKAAIWLKS